MAGRATRTTPGTSHLPRLPRAYVPRTRLWARLDEATETSSLTLLVGPAGAGKTLGVSGWLHHTGRAAAAWVSAEPSWGPDRLLRLLDRSPGRSGGPRLVVVDDAHLLPLATVRALDERLSSDPDSIRLLLLSRWDLPFSRMVPELLGHFTMLRGELLRLDDAESAALVAAHANTDSPDVARAIADRTQGWCAAVVLTARAVAASPDPAAVARRYADGGATVADRVASEVFAALHPGARHLLLCVANEPVVTPALAVHLSHDPRAAERLDELEGMGLLVTRVAPGDGVPEGEHPDTEQPDRPGDLPATADPEARYVIHPLLCEVVRRRTAAGGVDVVRAAATVHRAVQLDVARGATADAFRRLVAVGDATAAAGLLADEGPALLLRGHGASVGSFALAHPSAIEVNPGSWFAVALERWFTDEIATARHWLDRIVDGPLPEGESATLQVACVRLMRARLGLEPVPAAVARAEAVLAADEPGGDDALVPILLSELAITQNWTGALAEAEANLTTAVRLSRSRDLPVLTAVALSHLAFTEYMQGRENAAIEVADEVLSLVEGKPWKARFSAARARLARELSVSCEAPSIAVTPTAEDPEPIVHAADLATKFWARTRKARVELAEGSLAGAERALDHPLEAPALPDHLAVVQHLERAFLAVLAGDPAALAPLQDRLAELGASGEAALVAGLRADLVGDRRAAVVHLADAARDAREPQPAVRALALVARAQLLAELGDPEGALDDLHLALTATEARRNAVPFLGWVRHGTPVPVLIRRLPYRNPSSWVLDIAAGLVGVPSISSHFGPTTALPRERELLPEGTIRPTLSPREHDVLLELARGSTYADIAANLFVSENTVKTHVSSLYGKLSVNRRSAALAAARNLNLL